MIEKTLQMQTEACLLFIRDCKVRCYAVQNATMNTNRTHACKQKTNNQKAAIEEPVPRRRPVCPADHDRGDLEIKPPAPSSSCRCCCSAVNKAQVQNMNARKTEKKQD